MKKVILVLLVFLGAASSLAAGGEAEAAASATRGKYLAGRGVIVPPGEIHVNSYIAQIDYNYPNPEEPIGITLVSGNRLVSSLPHREIIHIGIKGKTIPFEELPPLNLAFVIDKSGSMEWEEKMDWVKESFGIFIERVRDIDYVSLVVFDSEAQVLYPSTRMDSREKRLQFAAVVNGIIPAGGTNLSGGLELGYIQVASNYRREYTNRVLFLTDGVGESEGILEMAGAYRDMGINVSTIGVGQDFDLDLMVELSKAGGGSSRFISDRQEMSETFGSELDRMVAAAARDLRMTLTLPEGVRLRETWGYNYQIRGNTILYSQATLHNGDYETILAEVEVDGTWPEGERTLAEFSLRYRDLDDKERDQPALPLKVTVTNQANPVAGYSNSRVLKSSSMLRFAQTLIDIGNIYYGIQAKYDQLNRIKSEIWEREYSQSVLTEEELQARYGEISDERIRRLEAEITGKLEEALTRTNEEKKHLENTRLRLDNIGFDDEVLILEQYLDILGKEKELPGEEIARLKNDRELAPPVEDRDILGHIDNLFREVTLSLNPGTEKVIAVSGFITGGGGAEGLISLLDDSALAALRAQRQIRIVERSRINQVLEEQKLQLSGLTDTDTAIEVGQILTADFILTGNVIEMARSVIIFCRIINTETAEIESVSQIILPKSDSLRDLL